MTSPETTDDEYRDYLSTLDRGELEQLTCRMVRDLEQAHGELRFARDRLTAIRAVVKAA